MSRALRASFHPKFERVTWVNSYKMSDSNLSLSDLDQEARYHTYYGGHSGRRPASRLRAFEPGAAALSLTLLTKEPPFAQKSVRA